MKTKTRFVILLSALFIVSGAIIVALVNQQMRRQALFDAEAKARRTLNYSLAIHTYFSQRLKPKIFELTDKIRSEDYFEPSWMSSTYAIREINKYCNSFENFDYYYKECAINARSPENEANDYEKAFLEELSRDPKLVVRSGNRLLQGKRYFVVLRRGETMEESCMRCHSSPDKAPGDLVHYYGPERSFHRKVGDFVYAISVRVPLSVAYAEANRFSFQLSTWLLMVLFLFYCVLFLMSARWIFKPMDKVREKALIISESAEHLGEKISLPNGKELCDLTVSFNRMSESLGVYRDHLETRVMERTEELIKANAELEATIEELGRKENELRASEKKFKNLFDNMNSGVAVYEAVSNGEDFIFNDVNKAGELIDNIKKEDLFGKSVLKMFPGVRDFGLFDVFQRVWKTGRPERHPVGQYKDERITGWRDNFIYNMTFGHW